MAALSSTSIGGPTTQVVRRECSRSYSAKLAAPTWANNG